MNFRNNTLLRGFETQFEFLPRHPTSSGSFERATGPEQLARDHNRDFDRAPGSALSSNTTSSHQRLSPTRSKPRQPGLYT